VLLCLQIYIWQLKDDDLCGVAFIDTQVYVHSIITIKNLILVGDVSKSITLLRYQQDMKVLSLVSRVSYHSIIVEYFVCIIFRTFEDQLSLYFFLQYYTFWGVYIEIRFEFKKILCVLLCMYIIIITFMYCDTLTLSHTSLIGQFVLKSAKQLYENSSNAN